MIEFFGRLHPLIVHLPIGILLLAAGLYFLSRLKKFKSFIGATRVALLFGSLSAVLACVTGFIKYNDTYDTNLAAQHKYLGIITAFISLVILLFSNLKKILKKRLQKNINTALFIFLVPLIFVTGHLGGSLTHGSDFLFPESHDEVMLLTPQTFHPDSSIYYQLIQPLLQNKCYDCHSSKKQKGKLRLDREEFILKGGKSGSVIKVGNYGQSELLYKIHLPIEDDDHMPPSDNDQLTSGEIDLLTSWVESGASFVVTLEEYQDSLLIKQYVNTNLEEKKSDWWPADNARSIDHSELAELVRMGVNVEFLSAESNYVAVSFVSLDSIPKGVLNSLSKLKNNIISIRFSGVKVSQQELDYLPSLPLLRRLYLDQSIEAPLNLQPIFELSNLRYLNLSGNNISVDELYPIGKLIHLEELIVFSTDVNERDAEFLQKELPECSVELGQYTLRELPSDTLIYRKKK